MSISYSYYLRWLEKCNQYQGDAFLPFVVEQQIIGYVHKNNCDYLRQFDSLCVDNNQLKFASVIDSFETRSQAMASITRTMLEQGVLGSWVNELYDVCESFGSKVLFTIERAAATWFGIQKYGVHLNAYCLIDNAYYIWVARRSKDKPTWPGKLDHLVAGGHASGMKVFDTLIKECEEEAGIPFEIASQAKAVSVVNYNMQQGEKLSRDMLFVYDLLLPESFQPLNTDGEVESFELWPMEKVLHTIACTDDYKTNCNLVIIDFSLRHGFLSADMTGFSEIAMKLRNNHRIIL